MLVLMPALTGCYPKAYKFGTPEVNRACKVTVYRMSAGGNCETKDKGFITFSLWSQVAPHYTSIAQGISSLNKDVTVTRGFIVNSEERGPSDENWHRLLKDPKLLCIEACGPADWVMAE
jgi:hypothetical protein